jgi:putative ATP-dependent endonuclease of the OLD family
VNISKVIIKNYRCLLATTVVLNKHLNIIVGDNECGKSTFLEAIYIALSGQLNGRHIQGELHPHLFNSVAVSNYIASINSGTPAPPPSILIELYFEDIPSLAKLKGQNNPLKEDAPGVRVSIEFNDEYRVEYAAYVADPTLIRAVPVE